MIETQKHANENLLPPVFRRRFARRVSRHNAGDQRIQPRHQTPARILVTLLNAMRRYDSKLGVASLCIGGGEATAMAIERIE